MSITIPVAKVPEGLRKCAEKSYNYFETAKLLIAQDKIEEGYILAIYGLEEVGRAVIFHEKLKDAYTSGNDFIQIGKKIYYNHKEKQQSAMSILPNNLKNLAMGTFNPQNYSDNFIQNTNGKINILQDLRERAQYVDYVENKWRTPPPIDANGLNLFINGVETESNEFIKYSISYAEGEDRKDNENKT
ncbi:AbiV family abortive infection protein [Candidatus Bathyarchaeota archaeon]|nr:AbiV family abortive infection protein [Candidatus Bathyarchaeota archaeon]